MSRPLEGIRIIEVAMWAFVPAAGAMLADLGAEVIKVEPPSGDPIRGLVTGAAQTGSGFDFSWESYNRSKKSITLDLKQAAGLAVLHKLLAEADVLLTSILPLARRALKIDAATIRAQFPDVIYAVGSAVGQKGPEGEKGGYDAISFWARGGPSSTMTEDGAARPVSPPGPAFGDTLSGAMLAGAIAAAIAQRAMTGTASEVDVSLFGTALWSMQRYVAQSTCDGIDRFPRPASGLPNNVLVHNYRTSDGRFVALCMLQADRYWARLLELAGRPDIGGNPLYATAALRRDHRAACFAEMVALFESKTLAQWCAILAQQDGQWDVVRHVGEMKDDAQVQANGYLQRLTCDDGRTLPLVSVPMLFDGQPMTSTRAPEVGQHSDEILAGLGYDEEAIIDLKVAGVVH